MRALAWEGCHNVRDLGGLPTGSGGRTRFGVVVRADNIRRLTAAGWAALADYGVTRIVDLRFAHEAEENADFGDSQAEVVHVSLFGEFDPEEADAWDERARRTEDLTSVFAESYGSALRLGAAHVAQAVAAVARAPEGCCVVHCFGGKDRTGIVSALLLSVAGVPDDVVATDYAASDAGVLRLLDGWIADADDERERRFRKRIATAPAIVMERVLGDLRREWGDVPSYLKAAGVEPSDLQRLRARLAG